MKTKILKIILALLIIANTVEICTAKIDNNTDILEKWNGKMPVLKYLDETELSHMPVDNPDRLFIKHRMINDNSARSVIVPSVIGIVILTIIYSRIK